MFWLFEGFTTPTFLCKNLTAPKTVKEMSLVRDILISDILLLSLVILLIAKNYECNFLGKIYIHEWHTTVKFVDFVDEVDTCLLRYTDNPNFIKDQIKLCIIAFTTSYYYWVVYDIYLSHLVG